MDYVPYKPRRHRRRRGAVTTASRLIRRMCGKLFYCLIIIALITWLYLVTL